MRTLISGFLVLLGLVSSIPAFSQSASGGFQDVVPATSAPAPSSSAKAGIVSSSSQPFVAPVFTDVPGNAWFALYVRSLAASRIIEGYKDANGVPTNLFGPSDSVTVTQFLKMALEAAKVDERKCISEIDDEDAMNHWAYAYLSCALDRKLRLFSEDPLPALDRPILRGEAVGIIHDVFEDTKPPFLSPFTDTEGHPYEADIAYANFRGIISGDIDARGNHLWTFRPDDGINRAEAAKIIYEQLQSILFEAEHGEVVEIDVTVNNYAFSPKTLKVQKGQLVTLRFRTTGVHTFTVPALLINKLLLESKEEVSFVAEKVGSFAFQCAVQGHKEKGMEGVIVIGE